MARKKKEINKYEYKAILDRVVDGDTCDAMIDLGFNTWVKKRIRFMGVDTWESRTRDLEEDSDDGKFALRSHGVGKYGRVLGELFVKGETKSLNKLLIENGHAYEYEGGKKKVFGS